MLDLELEGLGLEIQDLGFEVRGSAFFGLQDHEECTCNYTKIVGKFFWTSSAGKLPRHTKRPVICANLLAAPSFLLHTYHALSP